MNELHDGIRKGVSPYNFNEGLGTIAGADLNRKDHLGRTPLHCAASYGRKNWIQTLIAKGADLNLKDSYGQTPIYDAIRNDHKEIICVFLENGTDVNIRDKYGLSPMDLAHLTGSTKIVMLLENCR